MKTLLTLFVLLFSSSVFADDISDFQIEGISIGDNLLDYFNENEIKKNYKSHYYKYKKDKSFIAIEFNDPGRFTEYDGIQVHIPNFDKKYIQNKNNSYKVVALSGFIILEFGECLKKQNEIEIILSNTFTNFEKRKNEMSHEADPSGKSITKSIWFDFPSEDNVQISCYDWSEEMNRQDHLRVGLRSKEYRQWINFSD